MKNFLYLIQGRKENVLKYAYLQNVDSDLMTLTFDVKILKNELNAIINIFLPKSSWAEGRNIQLETAKSLETKYLYYIFIDDDVEFVKGTFLDFESNLLRHKPAIGVPLLTIIKKTNKYNPTLKIQHPVAIDQQIQAYHYKVLNDSVVMPLETKFDKLSWWYPCEINSFLILSHYKGYVIQFNDIVVDNVGHHWDSKTNTSIDSISTYLGGVSSEGLEQVRNFIEEKYGKQPKLRNTLFHDINYNKYNHLPKGICLVKLYFHNIKKGNLKKCKRIFVLQMKNIFNNYPNHLIFNEREFYGLGSDGNLK
jgi:hypothetical protein